MPPSTPPADSAPADDVAQRIAELSPAKRALLEAILKRRAEQGAGERDALRRRGLHRAPLSFGQQRLWWLSQLEPHSGAYNVPRAIRIHGQLDAGALAATLNALTSRHESLRTTFGLDSDDNPEQIIADPSAVTVATIDLSTLPPAQRDAEAKRLAHEEAHRPFDLATGPLLRATLVRLADDDHVLLLTMHHIVSDGWSGGVLVRELGELYDAFSNGREPALPELPVQYADYAVWQRDRLQGARLEQHLGYWREQLKGAPPVLELPLDKPRPPAQTYRGTVETTVFPKQLVDQLKALSQREGATLFMTLLTGFNVLLARYTGADDIVVGTPIANRSRTELEHLIGLFTNTLVMRTDLSGDPTFHAALLRVREVALGAYAHQDLPFERLVEELQPQRDLGRNPLFQVLFALQNAPRRTLALGDLTLTEMDIESTFSKFDLALYMSEQADGTLWAGLEYNTDLFERETVERMLGHLSVLLTAAAERPDTPVSALRLLSSRELAQFERWNATAAIYPDASIPDVVWAQAARTPDAVAVGDGRATLTYAALQARVARASSALVARGIGAGSRVGICLSRTVDVVVALLAVLDTGAAYVPLDPTFPPDRIAFMVADAQLAVVLTDVASAGALPHTDVPQLPIDDAIADEGHFRPSQRVPPDTIAYVIYTSGSTGRPKGVQVAHRSVVNFLTSMAVRPGLAASDRLLAVTTLSFDIAGLELLLPLTVGARVEIVTREIAADGVKLQAALRGRGATVMQATPATWRLLLDSGWPGDPALTALCGGEPLPRDLATALAARSGPVWNLYGPTETTIWSAALRVEPGDGPVPVGPPIANTQFHVLDVHQQRVPIGVPGELYIGGDGVAVGYLDRPELTAERFVAAPWNPAARLYRTGDRVRYRADGTLEFLGRFDHQVKLRGFRIELGEIESALRDHAAIREAVVAVRDIASDRRLVAYLVAVGDERPAPAAIRAHLKAALPDYMIPNAFMWLPHLPLTPNGKVDRKALPDPDDSARPGAERVEPRDDLEQQLAAIWERVLKVSRPGVTDNFFDLGGHSLLAVHLFAQIDRQLGQHLPMTALFEAPTIAELAALIRRQTTPRTWASLVPIQTAGSKPPLYCVHAAGGFVLFYRDLAKYLGPDQPLYGLQAQGLDGTASMHRRVEDMAAHYIDEIRAFQPNGPYYLAGECFGGRIAFEMARQLHERGERVAMLALFNTFGPGYPKPLPGIGGLRRKLNFARLRFIDHHLDNLRMLGPREQLAYISDKLLERVRPWTDRGFRRARIQRSLRRLADAPRRLTRQPMPAALQETQSALVEANNNYVPRPYSGRVTLFRATKQPHGIYPDPTLGWSGVAIGGLEIHDVPGSAIVLEPRVRELAAQLSECLARAHATGPGRAVGDSSVPYARLVSLAGATAD